MTTTEESSSSSSSSSSSLLWAYDAGNMIERGTILVSRVESTLGCHDLRQPYFAKCVILIVEHESPEEFTQGIILNRPSNLYLDNSDIIYLDDEGNPLIIQQPSSSKEEEEDDDNDDDITTTTTTTTSNNNKEETKKVKMFFGGDLASIFDDENDPLIVCLHNITSEIAQSVSDEILPGIYLTSHLASRGLIEQSDDSSSDDDASTTTTTTTISADDFYTFGGFCGWDPGQLSKEIERGSWYLISASKDIIWNELQKLRNDDYDPRNVGIEFWQKIVNKIDYKQQQQQQQQQIYDENATPEQQQQQQSVDSFAELMLKEWATEMLMVPPKDKEDATYIDDKDIYRALKVGTTTTGGGRQGSSSSSSRGRRMIPAGSILRASHHEVSPFLLQNQFLHKSILLLLQETDSFSVGLVLNLPTKDTYEIPLSDGTIAEFIIRYGGPAGNNGDDDDDDDDEKPLIWLHNNDILKQKGIGKPVGGSEHDFDEDDDESTTKDVFWTCSVDQVIEGIESSPQITPNDFMVVKGFCVWEKQEEGSGGIMGQLRAGNFETIQNNDDANIQKDAWSILRTQQRLLDEQNLETNLRISSRAWHLVGMGSSSSDDGDKNIVGGDGRFVFNTTVPVTNLADKAMEAWMKIYLLGNAEYYW